MRKIGRMTCGLGLGIALIGALAACRSGGRSATAGFTSTSAAAATTTTTTAPTTTTAEPSTTSTSTTTTVAQGTGLRSCSGTVDGISNVSVRGMRCSDAEAVIGTFPGMSRTFTAGDGFECGQISGDDAAGRWACKSGDREFAFDYAA